MSRPIRSPGMASAATTSCGASAARSAATMTSDGSTMVPGCAAGQVAASHVDLTGASSDVPTL